MQTCSTAARCLALFFFLIAIRGTVCLRGSCFRHPGGFGTSAGRPSASSSTTSSRRHHRAAAPAAVSRDSPCSTTSNGLRARVPLHERPGAGRHLPRRERGRLRDTGGDHWAVERPSAPSVARSSTVAREIAVFRTDATLSRRWRRLDGKDRRRGRRERRERCLHLHALDEVDVLPLVEATTEVGHGGGGVGAGVGIDAMETAAVTAAATAAVTIAPRRKTVSLVDDTRSSIDGRRQPDEVRGPALAVGQDVAVYDVMPQVEVSTEREASRSRGRELEEVEEEQQEADDIRLMRMALRLAERARLDGEVPVGAVLTETVAGVSNGRRRVLSTGRNDVEQQSDASAHAEMVCLQAAARVRGNWRLAGTTLYVTMEPCVMCLAAAQLFRVDRVVYGASNHNLGACGGWVDLLAHKHAFHELRVRGGVLADECALPVRGFFRWRRREGVVPPATDDDRSPISTRRWRRGKVPEDVGGVDVVGVGAPNAAVSRLALEVEIVVPEGGEVVDSPQETHKKPFVLT